MDHENKSCTDSNYGEQLYKNGLAQKVFKIGDLEYKLNKEGEKFFDNIYLNPTVKEKEVYSNEINLNRMSTLDNVIKHKKYYEEVVKKIGNDENRIKTARLHDQSFKDFFEEYNVLIKYAIAKYGDNCEIKFCGRDISKKIKYDGIIKIGEIEEKIEITSPFHGEEEKIQMKQLNRVGISGCKVSEYRNFEENITKKVKDIIEQKNSMDSYDKSINLVVMYDDFEYLFSKQIANEEYMDSLFKEVKSNEYKFKSVSVLIDEYIGNRINVKARIVKIK